MNFENKDKIFHFAIMQLKSGEIDLSLKILKKIYDYYPDDYKTLYYIARTYLDKKDYKKSIKYYSNLLMVDPLNIQAKFDLSYIYLLNRKLSKGFSLYECRMNFTEYKQILPSKYPNKIKDLRNKKVFMYCEQGLGDTINFIRYIEYIEKYTNKIDIYIQKPLLSLMRCNYKNINFTDTTKLLNDKYDYVFSLLSIPYLIKLTSFNPLKKYLKINKQIKKPYSINTKYINIGLCWQGESRNKRDKFRSFDINIFLNKVYQSKIKNIEKFKFYSFQKDVRINNDKVVDLGVSFSGFHDTAIAIKSMDLIITVDTSVCHLSAALGIKTYLLLPFYPDWRWGETLEKSDLYASIKYFRQVKKDSWEEPFEWVISKLKKLKSK